MSTRQNEKAHDKNAIEVFYYPQCPWVAPVLLNLREITKELNLSYTEINLHQCPSPNRQTFLLVEVEGKKVPIWIGTSDKEYTTKVIKACIEGASMPSSENVDYENSTKVKLVSTKKINLLDFKPIQSANIPDIVSLCISEDFIYGSLPEEYTDKAKRMRKEWLESLIERFGFAGIIAYRNRRPAGFIEVVPGRVSEGMGISTFNTREKTWVILCLSVTRKYWGQGIASLLVEKTTEQLKGKVDWIEVAAHKKGHWHPYQFYRKCEFNATKEIGNKWIMSRPI